MAERTSPTVRRRSLAIRLKRLREAAGMSQSDAAKAVEFTASKMTWIEGNRGRRPDPNDVRLLCSAYGVDETVSDYLVQLARDGRKKGWWDPYSEAIPQAYENYVGLEAGAASVLNFEIGMIPGLLQTEAYARAMSKAGPPETPASAIDARVEVRMKRQEALRQDPPLRLVAVVDEATLHREVGGKDVWRAQLHHLRDIAEEFPRITIQAIPFTVGAHASMTNGFAILQFPDDDPDVVYVENGSGGLWLEDPREITEHHEAFQHLLGSAASPRDTIAMIARIANP